MTLPFLLGMCDHSTCLQRVELLGIAAQMRGILHVKLNIGRKPIAHKYSDVKMKRTLKRELKST